MIFENFRLKIAAVNDIFQAIRHNLNLRRQTLNIIQHDK